MAALRIEILNPKALQLIKSMQDLDLIKISENPAGKLTAYLKKSRRSASSAPGEEEIGKIVEEVRTRRYARAY